MEQHDKIVFGYVWFCLAIMIGLPFVAFVAWLIRKFI
jgi:hypothetical protein